MHFKKMVVGKLVLMVHDCLVANGLYTFEKAEKAPAGLWLAYSKAQLPFAKLQKKSTSLCTDLKCYIYVGLLSRQVRHTKPAAVHEETEKVSVAKV